MTLDTIHPDLASEQAYVDRAYACRDVMLDDVTAFGGHGRNDFEKEAFERWKQARIFSLSDTRSALVFGRIDLHGGETFYVGRHNVRDGEYDSVVVDWRAPAARAFYRADARDTMGLRRRRHFLAEGRELLGIADDALRLTETVHGDEILQRELSRQRGGTMRDIVSTIQAEQDAIIRAPLEGVVVVQGGPGTGKTAIGLHRAAFLLYEHRQTLQRRGVLVVGPNTVFIRYVSQVLPSLGESAMTQVAVDDLAPAARVRATDANDVAKLKGDARMAAVIVRSLDARRGVAPGDVSLVLHGVRFALAASAIDAAASELARRGVSFRQGREMLREQLLTAAYRAYTGELREDDVPADYEDVTRAVRRDDGFTRTLNAVWPSVNAATLVADLWSSPDRLAGAAGGILDASEQRLLRRPKKAAWTNADLPLVDEAHALIDGAPETYGHVVVDEAQDLSPMQLRMLARRCPQGSMTILGDLAQATGVWAHDDWSEVIAHLPGDARVEELTLGYRISGEIVDAATRVLREAAPKLTAPVAVRRERGDVRIIRVAAGEVGSSVATAAQALAGRLGDAAIIAPTGLLPEIRAAGAFGDADADGLGQPVTIVPATRAKGLEFDGVILVEPSAIVAEGGLRHLYVAMTRAMRTLVIVHADELPACLR